MFHDVSMQTFTIGTWPGVSCGLTSNSRDLKSVTKATYRLYIADLLSVVSLFTRVHQTSP